MFFCNIHKYRWQRYASSRPTQTRGCAAHLFKQLIMTIIYIILHLQPVVVAVIMSGAEDTSDRQSPHREDFQPNCILQR